MNDPKVTVIVTVYNIKEYLDRFFECLKAQTYEDYIALIIDDGSTDGSLSLCKKYADADERIELISLDHIGISAARNYALDRIKTEFVASVDGDDYFDKDYLKHLVEGQKRHGADLVISNVIHRYEDGREMKRFQPRSEERFEKESFPEILPALLEEDRLNYLYAKLYKAEFLRNVRVEPDVKQGSDTMINCQYVMNIDSIAVIEDYDYNYVRYSNVRSVVSYNGKDAFDRLCRINSFVYDCMKDHGYLSPEMQRVIDGRFLISGMYSLRGVARSSAKKKEKREAAERIVQHPLYMQAYNRQKDEGNLDTFSFKVIAPDKAYDYVVSFGSLKREIKKNKRKARLLRICPAPLFNIYHKTKIKLGLISED